MDVDMYERALKRTGEVVSGVKKEQLDDPTPCTDWTVRQLLNHIIGGCTTWAMGGRGEIGDMSPDVNRVGDDHVAAYDRAARDVLEVFRSAGAMDRTFTMPWGESPGKANLGVAIADVIVHGWDLAQATGQQIDIDDDVADAAYQMTSGMMEPKGSFPRGDAFAEPIEIAEDAPARDRLLAYLGRNPKASL